MKENNNDDGKAKRCQEMGKNHPKLSWGLSGQCCCSSLSQSSKEQTPGTAIFRPFSARVPCSSSLIPWPRAILAGSDTRMPGMEGKVLENTKYSKDKDPTGFVCSAESPRRCPGPEGFKGCSAASRATPWRFSHHFFFPFLPEHPKFMVKTQKWFEHINVQEVFEISGSKILNWNNELFHGTLSSLAPSWNIGLKRLNLFHILPVN